MKKLLSIIYILALAFSMTGTVWAEEDFSLPETSEEDYGIAPASVSSDSSLIPYAVTGGNIYFDPDTQSIVKSDSGVTEAGVPTEINGIPVKSIQDMRSMDLRKVVISEGITSIGSYAFSFCSRLTSVQFPDTLTKIGDNAFNSCSALTRVTLPESLVSIEASAFAHSGLEEIFIPKNVISIGKEIELSFDDCAALSSIEVDTENEDYYSENGVLFSRGNELICYPAGKTDRSYVIPNNKILIGNAISKNMYLRDLTISDGTVFNGVWAIYDCSNLHILRFPFSFSSWIGAATFYNCNNITDIYYEGCKERWQKKILPFISNIDNGSVLNATVHTNEADHYINGIELEVGEHTSIVRFESDKELYFYNTYYKGKPFSLMENNALAVLLDDSTMYYNIMVDGWDKVLFTMKNGSQIYSIETANAKSSIPKVLPNFGRTDITVDLEKDGVKRRLGSIHIYAWGHIITQLDGGKQSYGINSENGGPISSVIPFGKDDIVYAYEGNLSDYEIAIYSNSGVLVGIEKMGNAKLHEHSYGAMWESDLLKHWRVCEKCGQESEPEPHTYANGVCSVCGKEEPPFVLGDVNADGDITLDDAVLTLKVAMNVDIGGETFIEQAADVVSDGGITLDDAIEILKIAMNVIA